jgi:hypothetical protein
MVEFALVAVLLFMLLFGIVSFGVLLSFKQTVTQAANEGARAAAVVADNTSSSAPPGVDERLEAAKAAVQRFESWGRVCGTGPGDLDCSDVTIHDCDAGPGGGNSNLVFPDCITVRLTYDYADSPIIPNAPLIGAFMPDTVESVATAELTYPDPPPP